MLVCFSCSNTFQEEACTLLAYLQAAKGTDCYMLVEGGWVGGCVGGWVCGWVGGWWGGLLRKVSSVTFSYCFDKLNHRTCRYLGFMGISSL